MPSLRPTNVLQGIIATAVISAILFALLLAVPSDLSDRLRAGLLIGFAALAVPIPLVMVLLIAAMRPVILFNPLELIGTPYGDERMVLTRPNAMRRRATTEPTHPALPPGEQKHLPDAKK